MYGYVYKYFWNWDSYFAKKQKTGKRTHFAVTKGGETTYKEFFKSFNDIGTNICSNFVETTFPGFRSTQYTGNKKAARVGGLFKILKRLNKAY